MSSVSYYKRFEIYLEQGNWFKYSNKIRTVTEKSTKGYEKHMSCIIILNLFACKGLQNVNMAEVQWIL